MTKANWRRTTAPLHAETHVAELRDSATTPKRKAEAEIDVLRARVKKARGAGTLTPTRETELWSELEAAARKLADSL